jgi:hypothetical protein
MTKGGFLNEMLASKHATSNTGFLWRYLYYMYVGLPVLVVYYGLYLYVTSMIVSAIEELLGLRSSSGLFSTMPSARWILLVLVNLGFTVALYHFKLLPFLFAPVRFITSV